MIWAQFLFGRIVTWFERVVILVMKTDAKSVPIILATAAILGSLVGLAEEILIK